MNKLQKRFECDGYVIEHSKVLQIKVKQLKSMFEENFHSRFGFEPVMNRNLIKRFAESIELASLFVSFDLLEILKKLGVKTPVYCGPVVSHYTHTDLTGNSYGLPWHQDYPSMASSSRSVIVWISVNDCSVHTHGIEVASGQHLHGLLPGSQRDNGYILTDQKFSNSQVLNILAGDILVFSPYLPHRTFMNPASTAYKLAFSRRFDDLECPEWHKNGYTNAYGTTVDRDLYTQIKNY